MTQPCLLFRKQKLQDWLPQLFINEQQDSRACVQATEEIYYQPIYTLKYGTTRYFARKIVTTIMTSILVVRKQLNNQMLCTAIILYHPHTYLNCYTGTNFTLFFFECKAKYYSFLLPRATLSKFMIEIYKSYYANEYSIRPETRQEKP